MEESFSSPQIFAARSTTTDIDTATIKPYDFKHPKLVSKGIMKGLQNIHDLLSRSLSRIFTDSLNQKPEISLESIDEEMFSEFLNRLDPPAALFLFNIEELNDWALVELDPSFCLYCIERQGGSRINGSKPPRVLSRIEERIISRIIDKIFKELSHAWAPYMDITIQNHVYESKPANVRSISNQIPGIIVTYRIKIDDASLPLRICYPYAMLKEQMDSSTRKSDQRTEREPLDPEHQKQFANYIKRVKVPLRVLLGRANIAMKELTEIDCGDVIKLDQPIDEPLTIMVDGAKKMVGYPGNYNGNKAVKVFEISKYIENE